MWYEVPGCHLFIVSVFAILNCCFNRDYTMESLSFVFMIRCPTECIYTHRSITTQQYNRLTWFWGNLDILEWYTSAGWPLLNQGHIILLSLPLLHTEVLCGLSFGSLSSTSVISHIIEESQNLVFRFSVGFIFAICAESYIFIVLHMVLHYYFEMSIKQVTTGYTDTCIKMLAAVEWCSCCLSETLGF